MSRTEYMAEYYESNKERLNKIKRERRERRRAEIELNKSRVKLDDWLKKQASMMQHSALDKIEIERFAQRYDSDFRTLRDSFIKCREIGLVSCDFHQLITNNVERMKYLDYLLINKIGNEKVLADLTEYFSK